MEELLAIRKYYRITRRSISIITGISDEALRDYEIGKVEPRKPYGMLFKALCYIDFFEKCFRESIDLLTDKQVKIIEYRLDKAYKELGYNESRENLFLPEIKPIKVIIKMQKEKPH